MKRLVKKAKKLVKLRTQYGHSDVGDVFVDLWKGEITKAEAHERLDDLAVDFQHSNDLIERNM